MTLTTHARERLAERFGIKDDGDIARILGKFNRDFIRYRVDKEGHVSKTITWRCAYMKGVFDGDTLLTVVRTGWTEFHFINKSNPAMRVNKRRRKHG